MPAKRPKDPADFLLDIAERFIVDLVDKPFVR